MTTPVQPRDQIDQRFLPTEAVTRSRANARFVSCPACGADSERYLFHERGARFVQCRSCGVVYMNPPVREARDYFEIPPGSDDSTAEDREHVRKEFDDVLSCAMDIFRRHRGASATRLVVAGRMADEPSTAYAEQVDAIHLTRTEILELVHDADVTPIAKRISDDVDLVVLNQLLEACPRAADVVAQLAEKLPQRAMLAIVYSNVDSLPGRVLRRRWREFFHWKAVYFNSENMRGMVERAGLRFLHQSGLRTSYTVSRALDRALTNKSLASIARTVGLGATHVRVPTGTYISVFERAEQTNAQELLSVVVPAYNEAAYLRTVLDDLLSRQFSAAHEIIVVESNSTDGTREIAQSFEGRAGVQVLYEDQPRGKGSAVRRGLAAATGTIVLIQDADLEYDLDDYDTLLEPIIQRRTSFVLGSRSLGIDDWKVRRLARSPLKGFLMNVAQLAFARTFNALFQQRVTDINTMFKVFRRECVEGVDFTATGFSFDIELACMLVKNGYSPMEVPVNYRARGFEDGKKINFLTEFFPSFSMLFRCRFGRRSWT